MQFAGRMKTVSEKKVSYYGESNQCFWQTSDAREKAPPFVVPALTAGGAACTGMAGSIPAVGLLGAILAGLALPAGSGLTAAIVDRKVTFTEKQMPMTPEEEWAVMSPLERANFQVDAALNQWQDVREKHIKRIDEISATLKTIQDAIETMMKEFEPIDQQYQTLKDKPDEEKQRVLQQESWNLFENRHRQLKMRLGSKQGIKTEQDELKAMALRVYQALDTEIIKREQQLYDTRESLNLMAQRQSVLDMNKDLHAVQNTSSSESDVAKASQAFGSTNPDAVFALEKQKVEIETLMASIKTAMDVDAVLKSVSPESKS